MFLRARRRDTKINESAGRLSEIRDLDHNTNFATAMV